MLELKARELVELGVRKSSYVEGPIRLRSDGPSNPTEYGTWPYCFPWEPNTTALRRSLPPAEPTRQSSLPASQLRILLENTHLPHVKRTVRH